MIQRSTRNGAKTLLLVVLAVVGMTIAACGAPDDSSTVTSADASQTEPGVEAQGDTHTVLTGQEARDACPDLTGPNADPGEAVSRASFSKDVIGAATGDDGTLCLTGQGEAPDVEVFMFVNGVLKGSILHEKCSYFDYVNGMSSGASGIPDSDWMLAEVHPQSKQATLGNGDRAEILHYQGLALVPVVDGDAVTESREQGKNGPVETDAGNARTAELKKADNPDTLLPARPAGC